MKPSEIVSVKAKKAIFLPSKFKALTWMGTIYCSNKNDVDSINKSNEIDSNLKSHETIHVRQAESTNNSWLKFYITYIWQWICNLPLITINLYAPYKFIPMELEAYANENNWEYCTNGAVYQWKLFKKLTLKQKREYLKEYINSLYKFKDFINDKILPNIKN